MPGVPASALRLRLVFPGAAAVGVALGRFVVLAVGLADAGGGLGLLVMVHLHAARAPTSSWARSTSAPFVWASGDPAALAV